MAIRDVLKVNRKTFFNPRAWLGYDNLKLQTSQIYDLLRGLFARPVPEREETYQEALTRLGITNKEAQETGETYLIYSWVFFYYWVSDFCVWLYSSFLLWNFFGLDSRHGGYRAIWCPSVSL